MRIRLVFLFFVLISQLLVGQIQDNLYDLSSNVGEINVKNEFIFEPIEIDVHIDLDVPFINFVLNLNEINPNYLLEQYYIRFSRDKMHWSSYIQFDEDPHAMDNKQHSISTLNYTKSNYRYFQLKLVGYNPILATSPIVRLFFEEDSFEKVVNDTNGNYRNECEQPNFQTRTEWCEEMECPINEGSFTDVTHLIIHHAAGISESNDWAAVVRSIWHYHVDVRGWDDIGYNWLIAPNGEIFEGRLDNIQGAHFCGYNGGTMGVCMLGNYETENNLNDASRNALVSLLAWKSFDQSIEPLEINYHASSDLDLYSISGHQDGCQTLCPGQNLYIELDSIRNQVNNIISNCNPEIVENEQLFECTLKNTLAINEIIIDYDGIHKANYWIMDLSGTKIYKEGCVQGNKIDISDLDTKMYILRIELNQKVTSFKFIKIA